MKLFLLGRAGSVNHWLEDAAAAFRAEGHEVRVGHVRRPWIKRWLEAALVEPLADALAARVRRFAPDLVLAIGGFHTPPPYLERLAALPGRAPLVGWVGDVFAAEAGAVAGLYDLVAYTDTGLVARHRELELGGPALFLPHAANLAAAPPPAARAGRMVLVANATAGRRAVVDAIAAPIAVYGPGWDAGVARRHEIHRGRIPHRAVAGLYARHLAALNIRNERNVLRGLNQRSFDPCLSATPIVSDNQADLGLCFEAGVEVLVYRDADELNGVHARLLGAPDEAARIGQAGRRRLFAEHGFGHRLTTLLAAI